MKRITHIMAALTILTSASGAQERNVLVEMFTNSHCGLCPPAHNALKSYGASSQNASRIRYIFYHVPFPYPDDPLAQVAAPDAAGRNQYYGPFSATPVTFFDGVNQGTAYASWGSSLDTRAGVPSPLEITLFGTRTDSVVMVNATIRAVGTLPAGALAIHFVLVENLTYRGRNGVTPQDFVMRKMLAGPDGDPFVIGTGETRVIEKTTPLSNVTSMDDAGFVVFVQEVVPKAVLQSEYIAYSVLAGVDTEAQQPAGFRLEQNFPNPFNPGTRIRYAVPAAGRAGGSQQGEMGRITTLTVFDLLGREAAVLVNEEKEAGTYEVTWDASGYPSGVYVYQLKSGDLVQTRRMIFLK